MQERGVQDTEQMLIDILAERTQIDEVLAPDIIGRAIKTEAGIIGAGGGIDG
jgi:hypothetical protein